MDTMEFQAAVGKHAKRADADPIRVVDELAEKIDQAVETARSIGLSNEEMDKVRSRLITEAESQWMQSRYAVLDMTFARAMQKFLVGRDADNPSSVSIIGRADDATEEGKGQKVVAFPVYCQMWDSLSDFVGRFDLHEGYARGLSSSNDVGFLPEMRVGQTRYQGVKLYANAKMPSGITGEMFVRVRRAIAFLELFDVLLFDRGLVWNETHSAALWDNPSVAAAGALLDGLRGGL